MPEAKNQHINYILIIHTRNVWQCSRKLRTDLYSMITILVVVVIGFPRKNQMLTKPNIKFFQKNSRNCILKSTKLKSHETISNSKNIKLNTIEYKNKFGSETSDAETSNAELVLVPKHTDTEYKRNYFIGPA